MEYRPVPTVLPALPAGLAAVPRQPEPSSPARAPGLAPPQAVWRLGAGISERRHETPAAVVRREPARLWAAPLWQVLALAEAAGLQRLRPSPLGALSPSHGAPERRRCTPRIECGGRLQAL